MTFTKNGLYEGLILSKNNLMCSVSPDFISTRTQYCLGSKFLTERTHFTILITSKNLKPPIFTHAMVGIAKFSDVEQTKKFDTFYGYSGSGISKKVSRRDSTVSSPFGSSFGAGDKISIIFEPKEEKIRCFKNGIFQGILRESLGFKPKLSKYMLQIGLYDTNFDLEILPDEKEPIHEGSEQFFQPTTANRVEYSDNYRTVTLKKAQPFCCLGTKIFPQNQKRHYIEFTINKCSDSNMMIGFSTTADYTDLTLKTPFSSMNGGFGFTSSGMLIKKDCKDIKFKEGYITGDVIGFALDYQKKNIHIYKNREYLGVAFTSVKVFPSFAVLLSSIGDSVTFDDKSNEPSSLVCITSESNEDQVEVRSKKMSQYKIIKVLGGGGFGKVFLCKKKDSLVALKRIECLDINESNNALSEYSQLKSLDHPNILKTHDSFIDTINDTLCVLIETDYYESGDLFNFTLSNQQFDKKDCALQMINAIEYLHSTDMIHRDLKPQNILVKKTDQGYLYCICDFGFAKNKEFSKLNSVVGTQSYMSIEMIKDKSYSFPIDIFAFGGILYFLFLQKEKVFYLELLSDSNRFYKEIRKDFKENPEIGELIIQCFDIDPNKRPKAKEVKEIIEKLKKN